MITSKLLLRRNRVPLWLLKLWKFGLLRLKLGLCMLITGKRLLRRIGLIVWIESVKTDWGIMPKFTADLALNRTSSSFATIPATDLAMKTRELFLTEFLIRKSTVGVLIRLLKLRIRYSHWIGCLLSKMCLWCSWIWSRGSVLKQFVLVLI